jgi:hypothetical protein
MLRSLRIVSIDSHELEARRDSDTRSYRQQFGEAHRSDSGSDKESDEDEFVAVVGHRSFSLHEVDVAQAWRLRYSEK